MARTRAQDYDVKRESILRKSAELFAMRGYGGTSISMIAEACGVSKALLYHYYPDKEAILYDVLSEHLGALLVVVETAAAAHPAGRERLFAMAEALLEAYRDADAQHQTQTANLKILPEDKVAILVGMERKLVGLFAEAIAAAAPEIGHGPHLKAVTMSLFGMLNWHYLWFRENKGLSRAEYARMATQIILSGAGPATSALSSKGAPDAPKKPRQSLRMAGRA